MFGWFKKKAVSPSPAPAEMSLQEALTDLLRGHHLNAETYEDWVLVDSNLPGLRGSYIKKEDSRINMLDVAFELRLNSGRSIWERYAGWGESEDQAVGQALFKFCTGAFHVFLSAYWNHHETDQVEIEHWTIQGEPWDAYTGAMIWHASDGQKAGLPTNFMPVVQNTISSTTLPPEDHWLSFYGANNKGELTMEARLDNEIWPELNEKLAKLDWPPAEGFYSQRNFILLRPAVDSPVTNV